VVVFLTYIWNMPGLYLSQDTDYAECGFSCACSVFAGKWHDSTIN